jgi:hypothetical protein
MRRIEENTGEKMARIFRKVNEFNYTAPSGIPDAVVKRLAARRSSNNADLVQFPKKTETPS